MSKLTASDIEIALALFWFDYRKHLIVPNVSWGMFNHELDLCVLSVAGYVSEVEIKISKADIKKDRDKPHQHRDHRHRIKYLWFAVPDHLNRDDVIELIPKPAGILLVSKPGKNHLLYGVSMLRKAEADPQAQKLSDEDRFKLARLGAIRIWPLKRRLLRS